MAEDLFTDLPDSQGRHVDARHVRSYFWSQLARAVALVTTVQELADPGDRVADVGTGYGFYAIILQELYHLEIYATDLETNLAPYGGLRRLFHVPEFAFDVTAPGLPIPAGNMDGVILSEVVEHLRVHPALPICNCARLVRDEGWILLTTPNVCRLPNILRILAGRNVSEPFPLEDVIGDGRVAPNLDTRAHPREYCAREIADAVRRSGLRLAWLRTANLPERAPGSSWARLPSPRRLAGTGMETITRVLSPYRDSLVALCYRPRGWRLPEWAAAYFATTS